MLPVYKRYGSTLYERRQFVLFCILMKVRQLYIDELSAFSTVYGLL